MKINIIFLYSTAGFIFSCYTSSVLSPVQHRSGKQSAISWIKKTCTHNKMDSAFLHWFEWNHLRCTNMTQYSKHKLFIGFDTPSLLMHSNNPTGSVPEGRQNPNIYFSGACYFEFCWWQYVVDIHLVGLLIENNFPQWKMYHFYHGMLIIIFWMPVKISHNLYLERV